VGGVMQRLAQLEHCQAAPPVLAAAIRAIEIGGGRMPSAERDVFMPVIAWAMILDL